MRGRGGGHIHDVTDTDFNITRRTLFIHKPDGFQHFRKRVNQKRLQAKRSIVLVSMLTIAAKQVDPPTMIVAEM